MGRDSGGFHYEEGGKAGHAARAAHEARPVKQHLAGTGSGSKDHTFEPSLRWGEIRAGTTRQQNVVRNDQATTTTSNKNQNRKQATQ